MSWLAPLYLIGGLSIAIPIWLHWIQRRPRGERVFSSLMFLTPSLPRTQRRHRLNNLWLLLLRGLALSLLAIAFARPFLRSEQDLAGPSLKRMVAICLDRSASMQRSRLWQDAQQQLGESLAALGSDDYVALFAFDQKLELISPWAQADPAAIARVKQAANQLKPGYGRTILGQSLIDALGQFPAISEATSDVANKLSTSNSLRRHVVVIGDMSEGSDLTALDRYRWPPEVPVEIRRVSTEATNGSLRVVTDTSDVTQETPKVRVRVSSDQDLEAKTFRISWKGNGTSDRTDTNVADVAANESVQVPPGGTRVVLLPVSREATAIHLEGDDHPYDNDWYVSQQSPVEKRLGYVGSTSDIPESLAFYLRRADLSTSAITVKWNGFSTENELLASLDALATPLVIHEGPPGEEQLSRWQNYLEQGGRLLVTFTSPLPSPNGGETSASMASTKRSVPGLAKLCGVDALEIEPVECQEYVLWASVDYRSELFAPFRDAQFNDFSKIRVWRYHRLTPASAANWQTLVSFDDQSPALIQRQVGKGQLLVLTTSWAPRDSQLALSTKFVPMLALWMGGELVSEAPQRTLFVGDPIPLQAMSETIEVQRPDGKTESVRSEEPAYAQTDLPGIYTVKTGGQSWNWAVNLPPEESQTLALDPGELTRRGLTLDAADNASQLAQQERQRQEHEIEENQSWWRWLLVACLGVLALETYLAGRADRSRPESELAPQIVS